MASVRERKTKAGTKFYEIRVRRGRESAALSMNWYPPDGWSAKAIQRELAKVASEFERQVKAGEIVSREEQREREALEAAERAKLKTVRQYAEGVFLPTKQAVMSENGVSSYKIGKDEVTGSNPVISSKPESLMNQRFSGFFLALFGLIFAGGFLQNPHLYPHGA